MFGVLGCGNMASAIVKGVHEIYKSEKFLTYTPSVTRAKDLALAVNGDYTENLSDFEKAKTLMIACKPQQFLDLANSLKEKVDLSNKHIISVMAAVSVESMKEKLGASKITRIMPNTPAMYNEGVSLVFHSVEVEQEQRELTHKFFSACSKVHMMDSEIQLDQVTTVSGCGPAYVYLFAKYLSDSLKEWNISEDEAKRIVVQLFKGSALLMEKAHGLSFDEMIAQVTSKGGVTIEAVNVFKELGLDVSTKKALDAALKRSDELTKLF